MSNLSVPGLQLVQYPSGRGSAQPVELTVVSGLQPVANSLNVDFNVGDPCIMLGTGGNVAPGSGTGNTVFTVGDALFGVIEGVVQYYDGTLIQRGLGNRVPGGTTYTTTERETRVLVQPFADGQLWMAQFYGTVIGSTRAAYRSIIGANVAPIYSGANATTKKANLMLDDGTTTAPATTATLVFRVIDIPDATIYGPQDFTSAYVKAIVTPNYVQTAPYQTTGV